MAMIEVNGLTKRFAAGLIAVDHVTFAVEKGSVVGFLGWRVVEVGGAVDEHDRDGAVHHA